MIDLSQILQNQGTEECTVEYYDHNYGKDMMCRVFGVDPADIFEGIGWAGERAIITTHTGTHVDAPYHYGPYCKGAKATTIDKLPIAMFRGQYCVVDVRDQPCDKKLVVQQVEEQFISGSSIVLFCTGASHWYGKPKYRELGVCIGAEVLIWLLARGVYTIGVDAWSVDGPVNHSAARFRQSDDVREVWPTHYAGREHWHLQIENMNALESVLGTTGELWFAPIKVQSGSAGWCRPIAEINSRQVN